MRCRVARRRAPRHQPTAAVHRDALHDVAVAFLDHAGNLVRRRDHAERVDHLVGDQCRHRCPVALLRQPVQLGLQRRPTRVRRAQADMRAWNRRTRAAAASRRARARAPARSCTTTVITGNMISKSARGRPAVASPRSSAGQRRLAHELLRRERVDHEAVGDLARDLGHARTDAGQEDAGQAVRARAGTEHRRHQRVRVELAAEVELRSLVPATPRSPGCASTISRIRAAGLRPRHREPLLDVRLDLRSEPEVEPALRGELQVVGEARQRHWRARERDRDRGRELQSLAVLRREEQREERIVWALEREHAVVALRFELRRAAARGRVG